MAFKRKRRTRRKRKGRDTVRKVRRAVRGIQRQVETKDLIVDHGTFNVKVTPIDIFAQALITSDTGVNAHQFIGRKYHAVGIKVNCVIKKITDNTGQVGSLRFIGLWVRGLSPVAGTAGTFFDYYNQYDSTGASAQLPTPLAPMKSSKAKNVRVLWDKKIAFGIKNTADGGFAAGLQNKFLNFYKSINSPCVFNTDTDEITQGKLYIWVMDQFDNQVAVSLVTKFYFKDS